MNDPSGSRWRKWDLHFHTPKSHDHGNKGMSARNIVDRLLEAKVEVVAVTDHHVMDVDFISEMKTAAGDRLTVLPGIEVASNLGGSEGVHFIGVFPEDADLPYLATELLTRLNLTKKLQEGVEKKNLYVEFPAAAEVMQALGGIITIHGHGKSANYETISSRLQFKQEQKTDLLRHHVDIIEIGGLDHAVPYHEKIFPAIGFTRPLIVGSDDHCICDYPVDKCCWIKADPTLAGLRMALREPANRFCLDPVPTDLHRIEKNRTKYIKSIAFSKLDSMPTGEQWLQGETPLNPGLVAVIGNKGSGKSALADCIGLLGSCATKEAFSFLEEERFRHPKTGRAKHVKASMNWHDGDPVHRLLSENIGDDEPERVKYLPQNFVEQVCNDLATPDGGGFEKELKKVVFSKVELEDRLGKNTLDELVEYRTEELRDKADGLVQELKDLGEKRARLEDRLDPDVKARIINKIRRKKDEISSLEATKPQEVKAPPADVNDVPSVAESLDSLEQLKLDRNKAAKEIENEQAIIANQQIRAATAEKLIGKLNNLKDTVHRSVDDMHDEAAAIGLRIEDLVKLNLIIDPVKVIRDEAIKARDQARDKLGSPEDGVPGGLWMKLRLLDRQIKALQDKLSQPQREYQAYLEAHDKWSLAIKNLEGSEKDIESLVGLNAELKKLDNVPKLIKAIENEQEKISKQIFDLRTEEVKVFSDLYGPVQEFIATHALAKEHLKLEFKVEIMEDGFADSLLAFLDQSRIGSFKGREDGEKVAKTLALRTDWSDWLSVQEFLRLVIDLLHKDRRNGDDGPPVLLSSQIRKGQTAARLYQWLYGLGYLNPRYLLQWDGKDVGQLSPGERGTLLLIFYLLVDDSDLPLIIDQPEANLDNATVAEKLVHCIRDAASRRQVIIVTHNPNLAVVCDADQIIHASLDKLAGNKITYESGALENPKMNKYTIDVLEGGRSPFDIRDDTYLVCER